jgi:hypothetical protein
MTCTTMARRMRAISVCVLALAASGCGGARGEAQSADKIHHVAWPLDSVSLIGGYAVKRVGAPSLNTESPGGVCMNGADQGLLFPVNPLDAQYDFTVQALVKPAHDGEDKQILLHLQDDDGENRLMIEMRTAGKKWHLHSFVKSGEAQSDIELGTMYPTDTWHWVALTYTRGTFRQYVNGVPEGVVPLEVVPMKTGEMAVGFRMSRENWFNGCVAELRFATTALASNELERDVPNRPPTPSPSGAVPPAVPPAPAEMAPTPATTATATPAAPPAPAPAATPAQGSAPSKP